MGRYYSRHGNNLYIYVTKNDPMIYLSLFPPELSLFKPGKPRKIKDKMIIIDSASETDVERAEIILSLNGYKRRDHPLEVLEHYYALEDDSVLESDMIRPREPERARVGEDVGGYEMDIIIPSARGPTLSYGRENGNTSDAENSPNEKAEKEQLPPRDGAGRTLKPASEEELIQNLVECMKDQGFLLRYDYKPAEEKRPIYPPQAVDRPGASNETILGLTVELLRLAVELLKERAPPAPVEKRETPLDELIKHLTAYMKSVTPPEPRVEPGRPVTAMDELVESLTEYIRKRTPEPHEKAPSSEQRTEPPSSRARRNGGEGGKKEQFPEELVKILKEYLERRET